MPAGGTAPEFRLGHILLGLHPLQPQAPGLEGGNVPRFQPDFRILGHLLDHRRGVAHGEFRRLGEPRQRPGLANLEGEPNGVTAKARYAGPDNVPGGAAPGRGTAGPFQRLGEPQDLFPVLFQLVVEIVAADGKRRVEVSTRLAGRSRDLGRPGPRDLQREAVLGERFEGLRQRDPAYRLPARHVLSGGRARRGEERAKPEEHS